MKNEKVMRRKYSTPLTFIIEDESIPYPSIDTPAVRHIAFNSKHRRGWAGGAQKLKKAKAKVDQYLFSCIFKNCLQVKHELRKNFSSS